MARRRRSARNERAAARRARRRERAEERQAARVGADRPRVTFEDAERQAREVGAFATSGDRPFLIGLGVLLLMALLTLSGPLQNFLDGRARVDNLTTQADALAEENERLEQRAEDLEDPDTIEMLAREQQGLVRPGEEAYVIVPPAPDRPLIDAEPQESAEESVPWWRRAWRAVFGGGDE